MTLSRPKLGLCIQSDRDLRRLSPDEPLDLLVLDEGFIEPRREAAAKRLGETLRSSFPGVGVITYAWHFVTHAHEDGMRDLGTRQPGGAPERYGSLKPTTEVEQAWDATVRYANAIGAQMVILRTGASVSPGPVGRKRLAEFARDHGDHGFALGWTFEGVWTAAEASAYAQSIGVRAVHRFEAHDPEDPAPETWLRVETRAGRGLDARALDRLLELAEDGRETAFLFAGPGQQKALRQVAEELEVGP